MVSNIKTELGDPLQYAYRFRPLVRLLEAGELINQEIYFAKPEQLNDPMEGFRDIFWRGDGIVWENLLKHFILSLEWAYSLLAIGGEQEPIKWEYIPLINYSDSSFTTQHKERLEELADTFLSDKSIRSFILALAKRKVPIRRGELAAYLSAIHPFALQLIHRNYVRHGLAPDKAIDAKLEDYAQNAPMRASVLVEHSIDLENVGDQPEFTMEALFDSQRRMESELVFLRQYNDPSTDTHGRNFVFVTFCDDYVRKLESLVFPEWYTACFSKECTDSSLWGSYGVNHTAVCLKFKLQEVGGKSLIRLRRLCGHGTSGPIVGVVNHEFHEVEYGSTHLPIDFFRSLGRLPIMTLKKHWYTDRFGNASSCGDDIFTDEDAWRKRYWKDFDHAIASKLKAWHYEVELRLILSGAVLDFSSNAARVAHYEFDDLQGIIFGMRTPKDKKIEICRIIENKCRTSGRNDFKFYQACYSRSTGSIEPVELHFLKFQP